MYLQYPGGGVGGSGSGVQKFDVALVGTKDGVNTVFTTPDNFVNQTDNTIRVLWNGRRLHLNDDFTVSESGGIGTGFDTITLLYPKPPVASSVLTADYFVAA